MGRTETRAANVTNVEALAVLFIASKRKRMRIERTVKRE
jgi:hypothetical protein